MLLSRIKRIIFESYEKHHVTAPSVRFQPPTEGHGEVIDTVKSEAKKVGGSHSIVLSHSHDAKNPLTPEQKLKHAKRAWPDMNISTSSVEQPTLLHHLANLHKQGVTHVTVVGGQDRVEGFRNLIHKYNGQTGAHGYYNFKGINVVSAGERDPDAEDVTGISGTKMRAAAERGDKETFHAGAPSNMTPDQKDEMMRDVQNGMKKFEKKKISKK